MTGLFVISHRPLRLEADTLYQELGVAEALQKKFLASLQLSIYKNGEIEPKNLVEAYIMSFAYDGGIPSLQLTTETSTTENASTKTLNLEYAKHGVNQLYEDFITSVQDSEILSEVTDEPSARPPGLFFQRPGPEPSDLC